MHRQDGGRDDRHRQDLRHSNRPDHCTFLGEQVRNGALYIARGVVSDPDDNMEALIVHWFLGDEEKPRECPQGRPDEDGITQCDVSFSRDKPLIRLRVQDDEGNIYEDGVSVEVVDASAPTVTITSPRPPEFRETDLINFEGNVSDGEDFPEALSLRWESSLSGMSTSAAQSMPMEMSRVRVRSHRGPTPSACGPRTHRDVRPTRRR